jgi:hypothetical protein
MTEKDEVESRRGELARREPAKEGRRYNGKNS